MFYRSRSSLRTKLILGSLIVAILPLAGMVAYYFTTLSSLLVENSRQDLETGAQHTAQTLDAFFSENIFNLASQAQLSDLSEFLKGTDEERRKLTPRINAIFHSLGRVLYQGYLQSFLLIDKSGTVVYDQTQLDIGKDFSKTEFFQNTWQSSYPQITLTSSDKQGNRAIYFSSVVWDEHGQKAGVLANRYNLSVIQFIIDESAKFARSDSFSIVTEQNGNVIGWYHKPHPPQDTITLNRIEPLSLARNVKILQEDYALVYVHTDTLSLHVIYVRQEALIREYLFKSIKIVGAIALFNLLFAVGLAMFVAQRTIKPINELSQISRALSNGDWSARATVNSIDEIGELGNVFNLMADQILTEVQTIENLNKELIEAYNYTLDGWAKALELRDKETQGHSKRVTNLAVALGKATGLDENDLRHLQFGAQLHDIGKMVIPDEILHKPGPLTDEEREAMKKHPEYAHQILKDVLFLEKAIVIPRYHHEKWDGSGYPQGLKGEEIPLFARIFAVADVWDAVTSDRPYNSAWSAEKAKAYILEEKGKHFDPEIVDVFLSDVLDNFE